MKINNWAIVSTNSPYTAPKMVACRLRGEVFGHPRFPDGKPVTTSSISHVTADRKVVTNSGSVYELGDPLSEYEQKYPNAKERLLADLEEKS